MAGSFGFIKKADLLFNSKTDKAISIIIEKNLGIKQSESLLIVYDSKKSRLAKQFHKFASSLLEKADILCIPLSKVNGQEPPEECVRKLLEYDTAIFLTTKSLSHTKARRDATDKGIRIASMPGITEEILRRCIDIDYDKLKIDTKKIIALLNKTKRVRIETELGTDLSFSIEGRKAHGSSAGIYSKKGKWGNLPEGEAFIAPVEGTAGGHFVVDGSVAGFGKISHPLVFFVENGYIARITDGKNPPKIEKLLDSIGKGARNVAEFGIGLNRKAKLNGVVLEDEKVYGTCHIALGNNIGFGGKVDVPLHIDCVIRKPLVYFDDKIIMKKGGFIM